MYFLRGRWWWCVMGDIRPLWESKASGKGIPGLPLESYDV